MLSEATGETDMQKAVGTQRRVPTNRAVSLSIAQPMLLPHAPALPLCL